MAALGEDRNMESTEGDENWANTMHEKMLEAHLKAEAMEEQEMKQFIQDYKNLISVIQSMKPKLYRKGTRNKAHNFINGFTLEDWHDLEQKKVAIYKEALNECNEAYVNVKLRGVKPEIVFFHADRWVAHRSSGVPWGCVSMAGRDGRFGKGQGFRDGAWGSA